MGSQRLVADENPTDSSAQFFTGVELQGVFIDRIGRTFLGNGRVHTGNATADSGAHDALTCYIQKTKRGVTREEAFVVVSRPVSNVI